MTTICYAQGIMAADRMVASNNSRHGLMTKIHKIDGHLVGISGSADVAVALLAWFKNGRSDDDWPSLQHEESECSMMVVTPEGVITVYDRYPLPIVFSQSFHAIGSGRDFALAALHLGHDPVKAIEVASALDLYTGSGVDALRLTDELHS